MRRFAAPQLATLGAVGIATAIVVWALDPALLLSNSLTTGGDTGAHVATVAFLQHHLLPHGHVTGWDPGWYDGYPLYTFYFPLPDLLAALAGDVLPANVAFKLVTALGSLALPAAAWAFGRLSGLERPRPAVLAVFTLPFLFDQTFTIYGGNIYSTMAGEYAYSLSLALALVFLGMVARGLRTGRLRAAAAIVLAACLLSHLVGALFAAAGAVVLLVTAGADRPDRLPEWAPGWRWTERLPTRRQVWWLASTALTSGLLVAWWALPFAVLQPYTTNMGWQNVRTFMAMFAPRGDRWALALAGAGMVLALVQRRRPMVVLVVLGWAAYAATVFDPQGKLYNTRFLPLWWLAVYLVAGGAVAEAAVGLARWWRWVRDRWRWHSALGGEALSLGGEAGALGAGRPAGTDPLPSVGDLAGAARAPAAVAPSSQVPARRRPRPKGVRWAPGALGAPLLATVVAAGIVLPPLLPGVFDAAGTPGWLRVQPSNVPAWVRWNYSGYQGKPGWKEYQAVVHLAARAAAHYGCGRAMWEYSAQLDRFGTPMALMLLPYWTGGCVDTQEGLLFESAASTPYHFLDQAELSAAPSDAMVGLRYGPTNVALGVEHLQLLGVRYFLASSPSVQQAADADPALTLVGTTGPWHTPYEGQVVTTTWKLYLVHDAAEVAPLADVPAVLTGVGPSQGGWDPRSGQWSTGSWLSVAEDWYLDPARWAVELTAGGLPGWPRAPGGRQPPPHPLPPVRVSRVTVSDARISFHVDRTGIPVLVRVSYFPAWHATGAEGPWRAVPNLMVVVPTAHDVVLTYGSTPAGTTGAALLLVGLLAAALLARRDQRFTVP